MTRKTVGLIIAIIFAASLIGHGVYEWELWVAAVVGCFVGWITAGKWGQEAVRIAFFALASMVIIPALIFDILDRAGWSNEPGLIAWAYIFFVIAWLFAAVIRQSALFAGHPMRTIRK